ncbi:SAV_915 family protein [Streptacidiphilus sp. N1-10]|uniref:SAV_915 family protein n=1 Tax=Streptacidiphilus jeojiensis TaxID=3229225 RepID=A0ABV6XSJ1_9ACTN
MSEDHTHPEAELEPEPGHHLLFAPVRDTACGMALRLFRERDGSRCAVAFSTEQRLRAVLGSAQRCVPLSEPALREMTGPIGVTRLVVDPNLVAPPVRELPAAPVRTAPRPPAALPQLLR